MKISEYFDAVKQRHSIPSDYALAKRLEIGTPQITDMRKGRQRPDQYTCFKIAIELGLDPAIVTAEVQLEVEKKESRKTFWKEFLLRSGKAAAIAALAWGVMFQSVTRNSGSENAAIEGWNSRVIVSSKVRDTIWAFLGVGVLVLLSRRYFT